MLMEAIASSSKDETWYRFLSMNHQGLMEILLFDQAKPHLVLLISDLDSTLSVINQIIERPELLNEIAFLLFVEDNEQVAVLADKLRVTPSTRIFLASTDTHINEPNTKNVHKLRIKYVYRNYLDQRNYVSDAGRWTNTNGLRKYIKYSQCCYDLTGYKINIALVPDDVPYINFTTSEKEWKLSGIFGDIFMAIINQNKMKIGNVHQRKDGSIGGYKNFTTPTGLFKILYEKEADIILNPASMTVDRAVLADFTYPVLDVSRTVIYRRQVRDHCFHDHVKPFSENSWILVTAGTTIFTILAFVITKLDTKKFCNPVTVWGEIIGHGVSIETRLTVSMIVHFSLNVLGSLLYLFYSSKLVSQSAIALSTKPFRSLGELAENSRYRPLFWTDSSSLIILKNSENPEYQKLWHRIKDDVPSYSVGSTAEMISEVLNNDGAYFGTKPFADYLASRDDRFEVMQQEYMKAGYYMVLAKNSSLSRIFKLLITEMREMGVIDRIKKVYLSKRQEKEADATIAVELHNIGVLLIFFPIFISFSLIVHCMEIIIFRKIG